MEKPVSLEMEGFQTQSAPFAGVVQMIRSVAMTEAMVLIQGETGVGKDRVARAIHANSPP